MQALSASQPTKKAQRQRLALLVNLAKPSPEEQNEISALRQALSSKKTINTQPLDTPASSTHGAPMPAPAAPRPSGITINTSDFVMSIAAFIAAGGIVAFMVWHFGGVEFLNIVLYMFLPVAALLAVVGLMKWGTMKMLYNFELKSRVAAYLEEMRNDAANFATQNREQTVTA